MTGQQSWPQQQQAWPPQAPPIEAALPSQPREMRLLLPLPQVVPGWQAPGPELATALAKAQWDAEDLTTASEVGEKGDKLHYAYANYKQFIRAAKKVFKANGLGLFQTGLIGPAFSDTKKRTLLCTGYIVFHAATAQATFIPFDWLIHVTDKSQPPKAAGAGYSNSLRYFIRGLLQIATDDGSNEDPEAVYDGGQQQNPGWPQHQQGYQGPPPQAQQAYGWQQPAQGYGYPQQGYPQPPAQHPAPQQQAPAAGQAQGYPPAPTQPAQQVYPGYPAHAPPQGYQQTHAPQQPANGGQDANMQIAWDPSSGEPKDADEWCRALVGAGWPEGLAEDFALQPADQPIHDGIAEALTREVESFYGRDDAALQRAVTAWEGTGFSPDFEADPRPRPTGLQALRYALKMNRKQQ